MVPTCLEEHDEELLACHGAVPVLVEVRHQRTQLRGGQLQSTSEKKRDYQRSAHTRIMKQAVGIHSAGPPTDDIVYNVDI